MSSSHGMKCSLTAVQQRRISAANKTFLKSKFNTGPHVIVTRDEVQPYSCTVYSRDIYQPRRKQNSKQNFITGTHVIVTRDEVQPDSCTAETYISRGQNIPQTTFYYRTPCYRHKYSRDIYQQLTKSILIASHYRTTCHHHTR
jgi:hypothetical protein